MCRLSLSPLSLEQFWCVFFLTPLPFVLNSYWFYLLFTGVINILLLNFLIAIIGDTYEKELERAPEASMMERGTLLCEIEDVDLSAAELRDNELFPDWLHVLKRASSGERVEPWTGRLHAIKTAIREDGDRIEAEVELVKAEVGFVKADVKDMKFCMETEAAEAKQRFEHLEASLASLHTLLIERLPQRSSRSSK